MSLQSIHPARPRSVSWAISSDRQADAFETYRSTIADLYDVTDVPGAGKTGFSSRTQAYLFGDSSLGRGRSVSQTMSRGPEQIRRSGLEHISIIVKLAETVGECDGREVRAEAGTVQFRDLSLPSASRVERIDLINLMVPRATAPDWLLDRDIHGLTLAPSSAGGRLVASHLRTLAEIAAELTEDEGTAAIEATFIIAERFMGRMTPINPLHSAAIHRTVRQNAGRLIEARLLQGTLDVDGLARALGVSRSTLYRAFEPMGGVRTYVQHRRLDRAYAALKQRRGRSPSVGEIAYRHGFASDAHFGRAFRARFGFSPGELGGVPLPRRAAEPSPATAPTGDRAQHDVLLNWMREAKAA